MANIIPRIFSGQDGDVCYVRELLIKYGSNEELRTGLWLNFYLSIEIRPYTVQYYESQKKELVDFGKNEDHEKFVNYYMQPEV